MEQLNYKEDLELLRRAGFTFQEITRLYQVRLAYLQGKFDWAPADLARLRFARWLVQTGKLTDGLPQNCDSSVTGETTGRLIMQ